MDEKRRVETLPRDVSATQVDAAEALLRELLIEFPRRPCEVKRAAEARGLVIEEAAWTFARRRLGATSTHLGGNVWAWAIGGIGDVEIQFIDWLGTDAGAHAVLIAERHREFERWLAERDPQMTLEVDA